MAFTAEELMLMQEEAEREHQASLEVEEDAKGGEAKAKEDEKGAAGGEQGGKKKEEDEVVQDNEEVRELREISRSQKLELDRMTREYERLNKILKDKGLIDEEDENVRKAQEDAARANYERRVSTLS